MFRAYVRTLAVTAIERFKMWHYHRTGRRRLLRLARFLERDVTNAHEEGRIRFNMAVWLKPSVTGERPTRKLSCGSMGCAMGFAVALFRDEVPQLDWSTTVYEVTGAVPIWKEDGRIYSSTDAAMRLFHIPENVVNWFFIWSYPYNPTLPRHVARRIRAYLQYGPDALKMAGI